MDTTTTHGFGRLHDDKASVTFAPWEVPCVYISYSSWLAFERECDRLGDEEFKRLTKIMSIGMYI